MIMSVLESTIVVCGRRAILLPVALSFAVIQILLLLPRVVDPTEPLIRTGLRLAALATIATVSWVWLTLVATTIGVLRNAQSGWRSVSFSVVFQILLTTVIVVVVILGTLVTVVVPAYMALRWHLFLAVIIDHKVDLMESLQKSSFLMAGSINSVGAMWTAFALIVAMAYLATAKLWLSLVSIQLLCMVAAGAYGAILLGSLYVHLDVGE